jgi:hypothetical protein
MRKLLVIVAIFTALAGVLSWTADQAKPSSGIENEVDKLNRRVNSLEAKLAEVQKELKQLAEKPRIITTPAVPNSPITPPDALDKGKAWREGEVNGFKYYIVPLNGEQPNPK